MSRPPKKLWMHAFNLTLKVKQVPVENMDNNLFNRLML